MNIRLQSVFFDYRIRTWNYISDYPNRQCFQDLLRQHLHCR